MITEAQLIDWFVAHPFIRSVSLVALGTVTAKLKADYNSWRQHQRENPDDPKYRPMIALRASLWGLVQALVVTVGPVFIAEVYRILGGVPAQ